VIARRLVTRAEALLLETGDFSLLRAGCSQTVAADKWADVCGGIAGEGNGEPARAISCYRASASGRGSGSGCWPMFRPSPSALLSYRKYLEPRFPEEVGAIYERLVWHVLGRETRAESIPDGVWLPASECRCWG
jgi:hypothetical protein